MLEANNASKYLSPPTVAHHFEFSDCFTFGDLDSGDRFTRSGHFPAPPEK
jgi:hypothetical protein